MTISGFIQAGGKSRRMGRNKALLRLGNRTLIEHMISILSPIVSQIGIITNDPDSYGHLGVECFADRWPGLGPLAGIGAALSHARYDYSLILACDMPFVRRPLLDLIVGQGQDYQVCVAQSADRQLEPLCALYHRSCLEAIERLIAEGRYSPRDLFSEVKTRIISFESFADLEGAAHFFDNLNTPDDFASAELIFNHEEDED